MSQLKLVPARLRGSALGVRASWWASPALVLMACLVGCGANNVSEGLNRGTVEVVYGTQITGGTNPQPSARLDAGGYFDDVGIDVRWVIQQTAPPPPSAPAPNGFSGLFGDTCRHFYLSDDAAQAASDCNGTQDMLGDYARAYRAKIFELRRPILMYVSPLYVPPGTTNYVGGISHQDADSTKEYSYIFDNALDSLGVVNSYEKDRVAGGSMAHELGHQIGDWPHLTHVDYRFFMTASDPPNYSNYNHIFADTVNGKCLMSVNLTPEDFVDGKVHFCFQHWLHGCCTNLLRDHYHLEDK